MSLTVLNPKGWNKGFAAGVAYACARLVEIFDQPTMAKAILRESEISLRDIDEADKKFLRRLK